MKKTLINAGAGIATGALGMIGQRARENRAMDNQKKLMGIQFENQQRLNKQGQELAMQTWKETNYPAQLAMMKEAGLNPSLMYGQAGAGGGTVATGSGGSAQGGNAPAPQKMPFDIGQIAQIALLDAQKKNIDADTENKKAEAEYTSGAQTDKTKREEEKIYQEGRSKFMENLVQEVKMGMEGKKIDRGGDDYGSIEIKDESPLGRIIKTEPAKLENELLKIDLENQAIEAGINLTKEQTRKIYHQIIQEWTKTGIQAISSLQLGGIIQKAIEIKK